MKEKWLKTIFFIVFVFLVLFQIKTTNFKSAYSFTPAEIDQQIQRMNEYPPSLARVGYILEAKKEIQIIKKLENNFFTAVDFNEYIPNRVPYFLSPFILIGLYLFIKERQKRKMFFYSFLFSVFLLAVIGPYAKYGPVLMYPFFLLFIYLCAKKLFSF